MKSESKRERLPRHIAFIMDGNGRWAAKRLLPRKIGHREGVKTIRRIVFDAFEIGVPIVSLFAFSTENKSRPADEVESLFALMKEYFGEFLSDLVQNGVKLRVMGELSYFPQDLRNIVSEAVAKSRNFTERILNIALNYGSRDEIVRAANEAVKLGQPVTEESFSRLLYTDGLPDPDLIIRTSGEMRLSNFMLYQGAYSELFFTKTLWPDFRKEELESILTEYSKRSRRFGKV